MHEIGAVVLDKIPASIAAAAKVELKNLPRLMVSCDAVVRDSAAACSSGTPQRPAFLVEAKHRFPFRPAVEGFVFMGAAALPHTAITVEHFVQCQLQMLVLDTNRCDLISYSRGTSTIFHVERDDEWCASALEMLQHMHINHILSGTEPPRNVYEVHVPGLYSRFMQRTVHVMQLQQKRPTASVPSMLAKGGSPFLDDAPADNAHRKHSGKIFLYKKHSYF
jgi:hypothetical protein